MFTGAGYAFKGLGLITHPGLRRFVMIPLLINVLLFAGAVWYLASEFSELIDWALGELPKWLDVLRYVLWPLFAITISLTLFYTFTLVANIIAAPFNSLLAEKVEAHLTGQPLDQGDGGFGGIIKSIGPTVGSELRKLMYFLVRAIPLLLVLLFVPVIGQIIWLLFSAWMLAVEYADYPMGNHQMLFPAQREKLAAKRLTSLGFGGVIMGMTMIPVVNFIAMPVAVCGATAMWVREFRGTQLAAPKA